MRLLGMRLFGKREEKSAAPMTAISDLRAAQWSGMGQLVREGFERNPVAYRCVRLIAEAAGSVGFRAVDGDEALARLLMRPNGEQAGPDLMESFYGHVAVSGDAYLEAVSMDDEVRELFVLRPDRMKALKGPRGWPVAWEHRVSSEVRRIGREADGFMPVLHVRLFHPADDYEGQSPLETAARAIDIHNAGGLDWRPMSLSPADMDFVEQRNAAAREIALAFGVPPMLLGIPGDATYANYREANSAFWRLTILPLVNKAARAISGWLGERVGGGIVADLEGVPAFQDERALQWERIDGASFLTVEEKRRMAGV